MRQFFSILLGVLVLAGCGPYQGQPDDSVTLAEARQAFATQLFRQESAYQRVSKPPSHLFRTIGYEAAPGRLAAYLTPDPQDNKKHPAIIWITGGDCNTIGDVWTDAPASNDQTARAFRDAGIIMMFPSLRGGNDNPGVKEDFLGEVDDVLAAADYLACQEYVAPDRIYLGGHSTGGTLVLLVAECSDRFRAVFSFGPVADIRSYSTKTVPSLGSNPREAELRSPGRWLASIKTPTFVLEGTVAANLASLQAMSRVSTNPMVHFFPVRGANHFDILAPTNRLIAEKILRDDELTCNVTFTEAELSKPFAK